MALKNVNLLKSAFFISLFSTVSTLLAFGVQLLLAQKFGQSYQMDAYFAAVAIPQVVLRLLGMPLQQVFIPILKQLEEETPEKAKHFTSFVFWGLFGLFLLGSIGIYFFADGLSHLIIPGAEERTIQFAASLLQVLSFYTLFAGLFFTTQAIHIANKSFGISYFANAMSSLVIVGYTFAFIPTQGVVAAVYGLMWGAIVETVITFFTLPSSVFVAPTISKTYLKRFLFLFLPLGIGSLIYRSTPLVDRYFASFLPSGDISVIGYGLRFLESIVGFLAAGLSVVLLPISSEFSAKSDKAKLSTTFSWGVRAIFLLVIPTAAYLLFYSKDLIQALFERGSFDSQLSTDVAQVLALYTGALLALAIGGQMTNIFYAKKKHLHVVGINLVALPIYILLTSIFSKMYGVFGIALSYSLYTMCTVIFYLYFLRYTIDIEWKKILVTLMQTIIASAGMIAAIQLFTLSNLVSDTSLLFLFIEVAVGGLCYFAVLALIRNTEFSLLQKALVKKINKT